MLMFSLEFTIENVIAKLWSINAVEDITEIIKRSRLWFK